MKFRVLKLRTKCVDRATEIEGTVTHWMVDMGKTIYYLFQPHGLNEDGAPAKKIFLCVERLTVKEDEFEEIEVPFEILGSIVEDTATGFKGMAVEFMRHPNGCFHVSIQPKGRHSRKNEPVPRHDFDIRGCVGPKIRELSEAERKKSEKDKPSSTGDVPTRDSDYI